MKTHITSKATILVALLFLAVGTMIAQQTVEFAPVGAEWYYERIYRNGWDLNGITYDRFRSLRTTEINGWECKEIELYRHLDCHGVPDPSYEIRYVTQEGDRVYEVEDGERYLLYDFGKEPGESWYAPKYQTTITVLRIDTITMNDNTVRRVLITEPSNHWEFFNIMEGIGMSRSLFPFEFGLQGAPCEAGPIRCYSENGLPLLSSQVACEYEELSIGEQKDAVVLVIPSPITGSATVEYTLPGGCRQAVLELTSILGVKVKTVTLEGNTGTATLDLGNQPSGLYMIAVTDQNGRRCVRKVVKQ